MRPPKWEVVTGDSLKALDALSDQSVHCLVTSVPYWKIRKYSGRAPLGSEPTPEEWAQNLAAIFAKAQRVLRDDGTCWINIGDSYYGASSFKGSGDGTDGVFNRKHDNMGAASKRRAPPRHPFLKNGDLVDQASILGEALVRAGWYRRQRIVWERVNAMPDSTKNRPAVAHEYVLLMTKRASGYFYDHTAVREEAAQPGKDRNRRSVWHIASEPSPEIDGVKHTSTYPRELARICVAAGTSERGACPDCGAQWVRRLSKPRGGSTGKSWHDHDEDAVNGNAKKTSSKDYVPAKTIGWKPGCKCPGRNSPVPSLVLDPFSGLATTGNVCLAWGRDYHGIENDKKIAEASRKRLVRDQADMALPLFAAAQSELFAAEES